MLSENLSSDVLEKLLSEIDDDLETTAAAAMVKVTYKPITDCCRHVKLLVPDSVSLENYPGKQ